MKEVWDATILTEVMRVQIYIYNYVYHFWHQLSHVSNLDTGSELVTGFHALL
jgi:hypothetical protein